MGVVGCVVADIGHDAAGVNRKNDLFILPVAKDVVGGFFFEGFVRSCQGF